MEVNMTSKKKEMKKFKLPDTLVLLCIIMIIAAICTYVLPAGVYDRVKDEATGRMLVVPGSFHNVDQTPISIFNLFKAIPSGMEESGYIMMFLLIIGGAFRILQATGAVEAGMAEVVRKMAGKEKLIIPVVMFVFSLGGAFIGNAEEVLAFIPLVVSLCLALGFDSITGTAILLLGAGAGFSGALTNAFTIGVAQGISGLPLFSGIQFRAVAYVLLTGSTILYVYLYANKIQKNPKLSPMYEEDRLLREKLDKGETPEFTTRHKLALFTLLIGIAGMVYGVLKLGFYITELGAVFAIIGIAAGFAGGLKVDEMSQEFVKGAGDLLYACIIVGFARAITVVMNQGNIMDTIIYGAASAIQGLPPALSAIGMFIVQTFVSIIVPSGSGMAAISMPIMAPLADVLGITRQTAVLAFQFGDAFSNVLTPTSGYFMAAIAMSNISWGKWAKWFMPLFILWNVIAIVMLAVAVAIGYGPF